MTIGAIIVAAGRGERAGGGVPKQYREIGGEPVLLRTLRVFSAHERIGPVVTVIAPDAEARFQQLAPGEAWTHGGATRTASVNAGLKALHGTGCTAVMVHDAARPFVSPGLIDRLADALEKFDGVIPALPMTDALMQVSTGGQIIEPVDRSVIQAAQTPQAFRFEALLGAYAALDGESLADDAAVMQRAGKQVHTVPGEPDNFKITTPDDFAKADRMLNAANSVIVTGQGFDVHRLEAAPRMWLCGVEIAAGLGLVGHSDADVGLHALTDALLGAAGAGDIGQHFPPSDAQWKGASSDRFVAHALGLLRQAGGTLNHADITLIAEKPKIGGYRDAMRARVAELLELDPRRVNIKATTTEKLGFTGRGEGIAAQALVTARMT